VAWGILCIIAGDLCGILMDVIAKELAHRYPVEQIVWGRYVFNLAFIPFLAGNPLSLASWRRICFTRRPVLQLCRSLLLVASTYFFFLALKYVPLADATAVSFAEPFLVALFSRLILREMAGRRRWIALTIGFAGVLIVIRPGPGMASPMILLPLLMALLGALYVISTRLISRSDGMLTSLFYSCLGGAVVTSFLVPARWTALQPWDWAMLVALGALGGLLHVLVIRAYTLVSGVIASPFRYLSLVTSAVAGYCFFGDVPDRWTVVGASIIAATGLYIVLHETRLARLDARKVIARQP